MVEFPTLLLRAWTERISDGVASMAELCTGLPMHSMLHVPYKGNDTLVESDQW